MYSAADRQTLLELARASIAFGLEHGQEIPVASADFPVPLHEPRATFVTLKRAGKLRGCIGSLEAHQPLAADVTHNAYAAAFSDPRFPPLTRSEAADLDIQISVLTPAVPVVFDSEAELLAQLRPGIDGLILQEGAQRGTFLPAVWESLPRPEDFLRQLKRKAGLPMDYWSDSLRVSRYATESFSASD